MIRIIKPLDDTSPMPWGQYKGVKLQDVPAQYLHWVWRKSADKQLLDYIKSRIPALKLENKDLIW